MERDGEMQRNFLLKVLNNGAERRSESRRERTVAELGRTEEAAGAGH